MICDARKWYEDRRGRAVYWETERDYAMSGDHDSSHKEEPLAVNTETAGNNAKAARIKSLLHRDLTESIINAFYAVYNKLGFGFLEIVYCAALALELRRRGHRVQRQVPVAVLYEGVEIAKYRMDFVVDDKIVLEVKSTELLTPIDRRQLLNYLLATRFEVGLLLHFGPKPQFYRLIATYEYRT